MTSDTTSADTTLDQFELAGKPTDIAEVEATASTDVVEAFSEIERFKTEVRINNRDELLLVGRSIERATGFNLYHHPKAADVAGFAGTLTHKQEYNYERDDEHTIGFTPSGETASEETEVIPVEELEVISHDRTAKLESILNEIRTSLTDSDWTESGRADTGYGEWISAVNDLADFIKDLDDRPEQFPARAVLEARIMHGIARYPLSAEDLLAQTSDCLKDTRDGGLYEASPEAFRTLLFRYADQNL